MDEITKDMSIEEVLDISVDTVDVFIEYKIPCMVDGEPLWGTIEEIAKKYNIDLDKLLASLNSVISRELDD
ncbi:MAG: disulfide oxidoreductase [bacterium]|nr:disulfide oxidoreductase [bacterium]